MAKALEDMGIRRRAKLMLRNHRRGGRQQLGVLRLMRARRQRRRAGRLRNVEITDEAMARPWRVCAVGSTPAPRPPATAWSGGAGWPIAHGTISTPAGMPFAERLMRIHETARLLVLHQPDAVCIERLYFKQNITTGIAVAQARGVIALAAQQGCHRRLGPVGSRAPSPATVGRQRQMQDAIRISSTSKTSPSPTTR